MCLPFHSPAEHCDYEAVSAAKLFYPSFFLSCFVFPPPSKTCTIETTLPASQHKGAKALWHLPACLLYPSTRMIPEQLQNLCLLKFPQMVVFTEEGK